MDILLIGGTRFLGRAISDAFAQKGHRVYTMNRGSHASCSSTEETFICDKSDRPAFAQILQKRHWDVIVDTILNDADLEFVVQTIGSDVGHFIHTGSLGVYGEARQMPATENLPIRMQSGKDVVFDYKIKQEAVLAEAFLTHAFPATTLRMSYIYGAGDIPLDGWGGRSIEFFRMLRNGKTIPMAEEGRALLHPGHVQDLGRAFVNAAEHPAAAIGQNFNICGHYALMLRDYVSLLARIMGVKPELEYISQEELVARVTETEVSPRGLAFVCAHMCASIDKASRELDWRPEIPLFAGLQENIAWMQEQGLLK